MAVSYLSKPIESNPYVVPFDLNLMMKVNQYKQSQFYQNAENLNTQFEQLNSLDIANPYQKQHAQDVINNLSTQIQNMGGLDYSDPNISNAISGYASDVYNDKTIVNGIVSTKAIRTYDKNVTAMKDDPKLAKYYDSTREWYDKYAPAEINPNSQINYINGDINQTYNGPTAPTPYLGSDWDILVKAIKDVNPNIQESYGPSGNRFFIDMTTKKEVDPYTIRKLIDGQIDGKVADQLNVHAAYNYYALTGGKYSKEDGIAEYNKYNNSVLNNVNSTISSLQTQIAQEPDNLKRKALQDQLKTYQEQYLPEATKNVAKGVDQFSSLWDRSKPAAFYNLYTNKLKDDISQAYSYTQTTHKLIVDQEAVANARIDAEAAMHGLKVHRNANGDITYSKADEGTYPGAVPPPIDGQLTRDFSSAADLEKKQVTQQSINDEITKSQLDLNSGLRDLTYKTARIAGIDTLFNDINKSINNDPSSNGVSHPDKLKEIAQISGDPKQFEVGDIDRLLQNVQQHGHFDENGKFTFDKGYDYQTYYNPITKQPIVNLTANEITFFKNVQNVLDKGANGENIDGLLTNAGEWKDYIKKYSIEQNGILNNKDLLQKVNAQAFDELAKDKNLNPLEQQEVAKYLQDPNKYYTDKNSTYQPFGSTAGPTYEKVRTFTGSTTMASGLNKLGGIDAINNKVNDLLSNTANRDNYYSKLLPDTNKELEAKYPNIINYMLNDDAFSLDTKVAKSVKDIRPVAIVTDGTKDYIKYVSIADPTKKGYSEITNDNLLAFGVPPLPYPSLEKTVTQNGHLYQPLYIDPLATGNTFNKEHGITGPFKIDIFNINPANGRNSNTFYPALIYKGKAYYFKPGASSTANAALQAITSTLQNNKVYTSVDKTTYTGKDGKTYTADELKSKLNLTDEDIMNAVKDKTLIENPSLLQAMDNYNNQ